MSSAMSTAPKRVTRAMSKASEENKSTTTGKSTMKPAVKPATKTASKPAVKAPPKRKVPADKESSQPAKVSKTQSSTAGPTSRITKGKQATTTAGTTTGRTLTKPPVPSRRVGPAKPAVPTRRAAAGKASTAANKQGTQKPTSPAPKEPIAMPTTPRSAFKGSRARSGSVDSDSSSPESPGSPSPSPRKVHFNLAESKDEKENYFPLCKNRVRSKPKDLKAASLASEGSDGGAGSAKKENVIPLSPRKGVQTTESSNTPSSKGANVSTGLLAQSPAKRPISNLDGPDSPLKELLNSARKKLDHITSKYVDDPVPSPFKESVLAMSPPKKFAKTSAEPVSKEDPFKESILNMSPPKKFSIHTPKPAGSGTEGSTQAQTALFQSPAKRFPSPIKLGSFSSSMTPSTKEQDPALNASTVASGISGSPRKPCGIGAMDFTLSKITESSKETVEEESTILFESQRGEESFERTPSKTPPRTPAPSTTPLVRNSPSMRAGTMDQGRPSPSRIPIRVGSKSPPLARSSLGSPKSQTSTPFSLSSEEDELQSNNASYCVSPARSVKLGCEPTQFIDDPLVLGASEPTWELDAPYVSATKKINFVPDEATPVRKELEVSLTEPEAVAEIPEVALEVTGVTAEETEVTLDEPAIAVDESKNTADEPVTTDDGNVTTFLDLEAPPKTPEPERSFASDVSTAAGTAGETPMIKLNPKLLNGVIAFVDVYTNEGAEASGIFVELLEDLGAKCLKQWPWSPHSRDNGGKVGITHVIFKNGNVKTMEKVRAANGLVHCVGVGWVLDCEKHEKWLPEEDFAIDNTLVPRGGHRRRKSMEPRMISNSSPSKEFLDLSSPRRRETISLPATPKQSSAGQPQPPPASTRRTPSRHLSLAPIQESPDIDMDMDDTVALMRPTDSIANSPVTPYYKHREAILQQTCPPKQHGEALFAHAAPDFDSPVKAKLPVARRQSLQVGSLKLRRAS